MKDLTPFVQTLQSDWNQMVNQQNDHTDYSGEQRYGVDCQNGVTIEVPTIPYP